MFPQAVQVTYKIESDVIKNSPPPPETRKHQVGFVSFFSPHPSKATPESGRWRGMRAPWGLLPGGPMEPLPRSRPRSPVGRLHHCAPHSPKTAGEPGEKSSRRGPAGAGGGRVRALAGRGGGGDAGCCGGRGAPRYLRAERGCGEIGKEPRWVRGPLPPGAGRLPAGCPLTSRRVSSSRASW